MAAFVGDAGVIGSCRPFEARRPELYIGLGRTMHAATGECGPPKNAPKRTLDDIALGTVQKAGASASLHAGEPRLQKLAPEMLSRSV